MLQGILLVILVFVSIAMVGVILLQRSEGGALGTGGGPSGFLTTRGAGDLLTRTTAILAAIFFGLCIILTIVNGRMHAGSSVVDRLRIDPLNPNSLVQKQPVAPLAPAGAAAGSTPSFAAPAPEVHTIPAGTPAAAPPVKAPAAKPTHVSEKAVAAPATSSASTLTVAAPAATVPPPSAAPATATPAAPEKAPG
jgi:preprotein translocase subunit SecG